jgi:DNA invertase Pin-like site-specific DNA recombinase
MCHYKEGGGKMSEVRMIAAQTLHSIRLRVAAYCRVSSDSLDQLASYWAQVNYYTDHIGKNPEWEFAGIYADSGLTGTRADTRDDFQRLLRDCARGNIDRILVKSISRFARNTRDCLEVVRQLRRMGVSVYFEKEQIDTAGLNGEMMLSMYSAGAQQESISISENLRWRYRHRMEKGEFITCNAPYGYRLARGTLEICEPEAEVIRRIFREYLSGRSRQQIINDLKTDGITKGAPWRVVNITDFLTNEKYAGEAILQKTYTTDTLPFRTMINRGERMRYHVKNSHPAIVSPEDYARARALLEKRLFPTSKPIQRPFSRRIRCAYCGNVFKRSVQNSVISWRCYTHWKNHELCPMPIVNEVNIQAAFVRLWNKLLQNRAYILTPLLSELRALHDKTSVDPAALSEVNRQIAELTEQNLILNQVHTKGYLDDAIFIQQSGELAAKIDTLQTQRRNLIERDEDNPVLIGIQSLCDTMAEAEPLSEFDGDAFLSIVEKIIVNSDKELRFRLLGGLELSEFLGDGGRG